MPWRPFDSRPVLGLALQGGGAHGAFTWGVLDALLEDGRHDLAAASGASAGAMNAVALAHGLAVGGPDGARASLASFWAAVGSRVRFDMLTTGSADQPGLTPMVGAWLQWTRLVAPGTLNPLGLNPLRDVLAAQIDFEQLRHRSAMRLFIAATHAATGRLRLFVNHELTLDAVLASACLPTLQRAVVIDGVPYWDGGYSANPALFPLVRTGIRDLLIVTLGPLVFDGVPESAEAIRERALEFGFHASYLRERQLLDEARECARPGFWGFGGGRLDRLLHRLRIHTIDAQDDLSHLAGETRLIAHLPFLESLRDLGRAAGRGWLERR